MRTWINRTMVLVAVTAGAVWGAAFAADKLNPSDQEFFMKAAQGNMAEVQLGALATQRAASDRVKQFGQRMVQEHGRAQQALTAMARENNWAMPTAISDEQKKHHDALAQQSGEAFDKAYMAHMVKDHQMDVTLYEGAAANCSNAQLKQYAAQTLPALREHLRMAREISGIKEGEAQPGQN
jgi:putative membrane protein